MLEAHSEPAVVGENHAGDPRPSHPYRSSLAGALAASLAAGLAAGLLDIIVTAGRSGSAGSIALIILGLYAIPSLLFGVAVGVTAGAWRATFGDGSASRVLRRLREDRDMDARVGAGLMAFGVCAAAFALFAAAAAGTLVAGVERKGVGALLLGGLLAGSVPVFGLAAVPVYRVTRRISGLVPRVGPVPGAVVLVAVIALLGAALAAFVMVTSLDTKALNLGIFFIAGAYAAAFSAWLLLVYGPLASVRRRVPGGPLVIGAAVLALILPVMSLRGQPSPDAAVALSEHSLGARFFVGVGRSLVDRDGDGHSPFLGGPDCDDSNAAVHPGAREIPGNGIDDNCVGGDRAVRTAAAQTKPNTAPNTAPAADRYTFDGNVLFIAIDTVRADALGIAGYRRDGKSLTPNMDALAARSSYFTHAYAQAPNTPRSFPSMFCSRYPSQVPVDKLYKNYSNVAEEAVSLWEVLRDAGAHTTGISSHFYFKTSRGIQQGFARYDNEGAKNIAGSNKDIASPRIVPKAIAQLEELARSGKRFGMFVHLFEPHSTYLKHPEFPITERGQKGLRQKYDFELKYVDRWVGVLLAALAKNGLAKNTMVVLVSDHGEAFAVHRVAGKRMYFHGQTLYDELLRVPIIVHVPGLAPQRIDTPVMLIDVAPTVVETLGIDRPKEFVGRSLLPALRGKPLSPQPAYGELLPAPSWKHAWKAMITPDGAKKIIYRQSDKRFEVYDLEADPQERRDLARKDRPLAKKLQAQLVEWMEVDLPATKP